MLQMLADQRDQQIRQHHRAHRVRRLRLPDPGRAQIIRAMVHGPRDMHHLALQIERIHAQRADLADAHASGPRREQHRDPRILGERVIQLAQRLRRDRRHQPRSRGRIRRDRQAPRIRQQQSRRTVHTGGAGIAHDALHPLARTLERPKTLLMRAKIPVRDHGRRHLTQTQGTERTTQMRHVRPKIPRRRAAQRRPVRLAMTLHIPITQPVERPLRTTRPPVALRGMHVFLHAGPVHPHKHLLLLQERQRGHMAFRAEMPFHTLARDRIAIPRHPRNDGPVPTPERVHAAEPPASAFLRSDLDHEDHLLSPSKEARPVGAPP